jgi:galactonate dehydratase
MNIYAEELLAEPITLRDGYANVPTEPGLGVTVDESAVTKLAMEPPYRIDYPESVLTVTLPGGRSWQFATIAQLWRECLAGNLPAQERGARLTVTIDDGSAEFRRIRAAAA